MEEAMRRTKNLSLKSDYAEVYNNLVLLKTKETSRCHRKYNKAISSRPDYAGAYYNLGNASKGSSLISPIEI